jgi:hypothetical protein
MHNFLVLQAGRRRVLLAEAEGEGLPCVVAPAIVAVAVVPAIEGYNHARDFSHLQPLLALAASMCPMDASHIL